MQKYILFLFFFYMGKIASIFAGESYFLGVSIYGKNEQKSFSNYLINVKSLNDDRICVAAMVLTDFGAKRILVEKQDLGPYQTIRFVEVVNSKEVSSLTPLGTVNRKEQDELRKKLERSPKFVLSQEIGSKFLFDGKKLDFKGCYGAIDLRLAALANNLNEEYENDDLWKNKRQDILYAIIAPLSEGGGIAFILVDKLNGFVSFEKPNQMQLEIIAEELNRLGF